MVRQSQVTMWFGWVVLVVGIIGFFSNPLVGDPQEAIFGVTLIHNLVHVATGLIALGVVYGTERTEAHSRTYNIAFGAIYAVVTVLGFAMFETMRELLGITQPDNVLHLLFAVLLLGAGLIIDVEDRGSRTQA